MPRGPAGLRVLPHPISRGDAAQAKVRERQHQNLRRIDDCCVLLELLRLDDDVVGDAEGFERLAGQPGFPAPFADDVDRVDRILRADAQVTLVGNLERFDPWKVDVPGLIGERLADGAGEVCQGRRVLESEPGGFSKVRGRGGEYSGIPAQASRHLSERGGLRVAGVEGKEGSDEFISSWVCEVAFAVGLVRLSTRECADELPPGWYVPSHAPRQKRSCGG